MEFSGLVMDSTVQAEQEKRVQAEVQDCWDYVWEFLGDRYKLQGACPIFERADPGAPLNLEGEQMANPGAPMNLPDGLFTPPPPTFVESPMGMFEQPLKIDYDLSNLTEQDMAVPDDAPGVAPEPTSPDQGMGPGGQMNQSF